MKLSALRHWGRAVGKAKWILGILLPVALGGCGTYVPDLQDWPHNTHNGAVRMVQAIVRSVECELKNSITAVVDNDIYLSRLRKSHRRYIDFLNNWGAEVAFTFTIKEKSGLNPAGVWMPPSPISSVFTLGGDASVSAEATRVEKLNFFYTVKELYIPGKICNANREDASGSLLIRNDLKIPDLLEARILPAVTGIASLPNDDNVISGEQNVMSHQITFDVVTSGDLTPTWVLTQGTINASGSFFSANRDRMHDLVITFGPLAKVPGGKSLIVIAEQSHFISQLGTSIGSNTPSTARRR